MAQCMGRVKLVGRSVSTGVHGVILPLTSIHIGITFGS